MPSSSVCPEDSNYPWTGFRGAGQENDAAGILLSGTAQAEWMRGISATALAERTAQAEALANATPTPVIPTSAVATNTVAPIETPPPTPDPENTLRNAIERALGSQLRETVDFQTRDDGKLLVFVDWTIQDNITDGFRKLGAKLDVVDVLKAVANSGEAYGRIILGGYYPLVDAFGNVSDYRVVDAQYEKSTVDRINWDNFRTDNAYVIADSKIIHQTFQD